MNSRLVPSRFGVFSGNSCGVKHCRPEDCLRKRCLLTASRVRLGLSLTETEFMDRSSDKAAPRSSLTYLQQADPESHP